MFVHDMEIYISDSMLRSINDKLENKHILPKMFPICH